MEMFKTLKLQLAGVQTEQRLVDAPTMAAPEVRRVKNPAPKLPKQVVADEDDAADEAYYISITRGM